MITASEARESCLDTLEGIYQDIDKIIVEAVSKLQYNAIVHIPPSDRNTAYKVMDKLSSLGYTVDTPILGPDSWIIYFDWK